MAGYPGVDLERVRVELEYLESAGLVTLERSELEAWTAELTHSGRDVATYVAPAPEGIYRPPQHPQ